MMRRWSIYPILALGVSIFICPQVGAGIGYDWSGHIRMHGSLEHYADDNPLVEQHGDRWFLDGGGDVRLNGSLDLGEHTSFDIAYELVLSGGQTRKALSDLYSASGRSEENQRYRRSVPTDEQQIFSLTKIIEDNDEYLLYQRIDRLFFSYESSYGNTSVGRQPLTWGNGLLFNPADLINPFAPSDIIRDYKIGSDMLVYQTGTDFLSDMQVVLVPRRDPDDGDLSSAESTLGLKLRYSGDGYDVDAYVLKNYQDPVLGAGFSTYLGDGVLRSDLTWTSLEASGEQGSFFSAVLNYDYSWVWHRKNWYGFAEFYYNGLGSSDVVEALQNEALTERLARGEIFVTGRYYLSLMLQYEAHPLLQIFATIIYNLEDNSFLLQPRFSWDMSSSAQLLCGMNLPVGSGNSEFGEFQDAEIGVKTDNPVQVYLLFTWYF